jgi:TPR repeat protein
LGYSYDHGKTTPKDTVLALKWYKEGAEAGDANAQNNLGIKYRKGRWVTRDNKKAMKLFKQSAEAGNPFGMVNLGQMYQYARGVKRDNTVALQWYLKAAEKSKIKIGCYNLGYFYEYGKGGLTADIATAVSFYTKAINKDEKAACMYRLGNIYEAGKGNIKADIIEAMKCYLASADGGNITGMYFLGHVYELMQRNDEANQWYKKTFDLCEKEIIRTLDDTELMICLAMMYENGKGTEKNMEQALAWYKQAVELGNEDAEIKLKSFNGN